MGYTDLTTEFEYKDLVTWVNLDALAENDRYDALVSGTVAFFYQAAAPTGWTKQAVQNDKALRVVSGAGGGSGGSKGLSTSLSLNHAHTVSHAHDQDRHTHSLDYTTQGSIGKGDYVFSLDSDGAIMRVWTSSIVGSTTYRYMKNKVTQEDQAYTGTTAPSSSSSLSDIALAYIDVIACSKDA